MTTLRRLGLLSLLLWLTACAGMAPPPAAPLLQLSPASLGRELSMAQQMQVQGAGPAVVLDVALEADATSVRMAVLQFGRTLARLEWDGKQLERTLAPGWPDNQLAERVLNDLQLVWWPAAAIRSALPGGWTLAQTPTQRTLAYQGRAVIAIDLPAPGRIRIHHTGEGYAVLVQTDDETPTFETTQDKP